MKWMPALILMVVVMQGCSGMQLSGTRQGSVIDTISPGTITVTFCGNASMTQKDVEKYALQRASRAALLKKGCAHFVVVRKMDRSVICSLGSGMDRKNANDPSIVKEAGNTPPPDFVEPNVTLTIQCVGDGGEAPKGTIDARKFLDENFPGLE